MRFLPRAEARGLTPEDDERRLQPALLLPAPDRTEHDETGHRNRAGGHPGRAWTFGGGVPALCCAARSATCRDSSTTARWAGTTSAPRRGRPMRTINPGDAHLPVPRGKPVPGCTTVRPRPCCSIGNGMYGAVIIDPPDLEPVDRGPAGPRRAVPGRAGQAQVARMRAGEPGAWC